MPCDLCRLPLLGALASLTLLVGCAAQRPAYLVEADGDRHAERAEYTQAISAYNEVIDRQPENWQTREKLAVQLLEAGEARKARTEMEIVYAVAPNRDGVLELLVRTMVESGDDEAATRLLRDRASGSTSVTDWIALGDAWATIGDLDEAEAAYLTAARIDAGATPTPQIALAEFYAELGDREKAIRRYRMALWNQEVNAKVYSALRDLGVTPGPSLKLAPAELGQGQVGSG